MYKYLLCWRYLKTRYIALASVISVMLGVATMIVVNSVMAGFGEKMRDRLHGVLADVVVECVSLDGFYNSDEVMARITQVAGDEVIAQAPTMETPGILHFRFPGGQVITRPVQIIGVRPEERAKTGDFGEFLVDDQGQTIAPSFEVDRQVQGADAGRRDLEGLARTIPNDPIDKMMREELKKQMQEQAPDEGAIVGYAIATHHRGKNQPDHFIAPAGHQGRPALSRGRQGQVRGGLRHVHGRRLLQERHERIRLDARLCAARTACRDQRMLIDVNGRGAVNQIQIKVKPGVDSTSWPRRSRSPSTSSSPCSSASRPGSRSKGRCWGRSPSSRASSTSCCSSSSPWPASASWRSSR